MLMTWGQIKDTMYNLMSLDPTEYEEYADKIIESVNYALMEAAKMFPKKKIYDIDKAASSSTEPFEEFDMFDLTKDGNGNRTFLGFTDDISVMKLDSVLGWTEAEHVQILLDRYLYIRNDQVGKYKVAYKEMLTQVTDATADSFAFELEPEVNNIVTLLAASRAIEEDNPVSSAQLYNKYILARDETLREKTLRNDIDVIASVYDGIL